MRINLRAKIKNYTLFFMFAKTQIITGLTSRVLNDKEKRHYVFWDLEKCTLKQAKKELRRIQIIYGLGTIFIFSDLPKSFRAWCLTKVSFITLLKIQLNTLYEDYQHFYWTVYSGKATLRIDSKTDRPKQKLVAVLKGLSNPQISKTVEKVIYETGEGKRNLNIFLEALQK